MTQRILGKELTELNLKSKAPLTNKGVKEMDAKEYLHSIHEDDSIFDPGGKQEYTEEQLIRFAEKWALEKVLEEMNKHRDD